jgi:hypothetical protein
LEHAKSRRLLQTSPTCTSACASVGNAAAPARACSSAAACRPWSDSVLITFCRASRSVASSRSARSHALRPSGSRPSSACTFPMALPGASSVNPRAGTQGEGAFWGRRVPSASIEREAHWSMRARDGFRVEPPRASLRIAAAALKSTSASARADGFQRDIRGKN